eukprot:TRINITY_DN70136_c0_g1_i1.p1 TRINITY_DN70136_c0_g1~~TRINITY_DN70136_c0_g1_i1.p1  ORF type:complete len:191 (-),score=53.33 TRINITY_DN70136_c0_g1_i1:70-588(-)
MELLKGLCCKRRDVDLRPETWTSKSGPSAASAPATETSWMESSASADAALSRADSMFGAFTAGLSKFKEVTSPSEDDQAELGAAWMCLAQAKALYEAALAHLHETRTKLDAELMELEKEAKRKDVQVPEALVSFRSSLDEKISAVQARKDSIDASLAAAGQVVNEDDEEEES